MDNNIPYGYNVDGEYTGGGDPYFGLRNDEDEEPSDIDAEMDDDSE